ncbi:MAG: YdbL family protein [Gammaproteobacteria bacterium]|nr:YdbL family protein [Gammaproteobacteria bacterium]
MKFIPKSLFPLLLIILATFSSLSLLAADLDSAKAEGLIGELPNGYLGIVVENPANDIITLVKDVNEKRKAKYLEIAKKTDSTLAEVELIAGKAAFKKTQKGHYILVDGNWIKK